jgi:PKD repeat protein
VDYYAAFVQVGTADCKANFEYTVNATSKTVTFDEKSQGSPTNFFWLFDDGTYSLQQEPSHVFDRNGMYSVSLTISGATCMDFIEQNVQVGKVDCNADFEVFVDQNDNTAYFTNKILGESTDKYWVFGDGSVSTEANPSHQFQYPGYYTVSLNTFNNANGCMDYHEEKVLISNVGNDVEADFIYIINDAAKTVKTLNRSKPESGLSYSWNFGDADTTFTDPNPTHIYTEGGYYNICLIARAAANVEDITCKFIKVNPDAADDCKAEFVFSLTDPVNKEVSFVDKSFGSPTSWEWDFGDGSAASNAQNPVHNFPADSQYVVRLQTQNASGCNSNYYLLVNTDSTVSGIKAGFGYNADSTGTKASGYPVDFVGISHGDAAKLRWNFGDGEYDSTTTNPTHEYKNKGNYTVCLEIWDMVTGDYDINCQEVNVGTSTVNEISLTKASLANYPNPFSDIVNIVYTIQTKTNVELSIFKLDGTRVCTIVNTTKSPDQYLILWNGSQLSSGSYYLQMKTDDEIITNKLIKK